MNNNRGNNRRRGRGNNRQQGGQHVNRIDSRARGNAPQLLEKYRKLAHDAHLNGDRVNEEYYLQFADHYFRVIADTRQRQEEQRTRRDERWQEGGEPDREDGDEGQDFSGESEYAAYTRELSRDAPRDNGRNEEPRESSPPAPNVDLEEDGFEQRNAFEPPSNPFTREARGPRGLRPRRDDRRPRPDREERGREDERPRNENIGLDPSSLPPSISTAPRTAEQPDAPEAEAEPPKPRRGRPRKVRPADESVAATGQE